MLVLPQRIEEESLPVLSGELGGDFSPTQGWRQREEQARISTLSTKDHNGRDTNKRI